MTASVPASADRPAAPVRELKGLLIGIALAAPLVAGPALAGQTTPAVTVRYGDLNLTTEAGTQVLLHRLSAAARVVCDDGLSRELPRVVHAESCFREALANAVSAIHNERLSALYRARADHGAT